MIFICSLIAGLALTMSLHVPQLTAALFEQLEHLYLWLCLGAFLLLWHLNQSKCSLVDSIRDLAASADLSRTQVAKMTARRKTLGLCIAYHAERICRLQGASTLSCVWYSH